MGGSVGRIGALQGVQQQMLTDATRYGGPALLPDILRAQRVGGALQNLLEHGGENLRSPIALGANLLATALLNSAANKGYTSLTGKTGQAMQDYLNQQMALAGGGGAATPQGGGQAPASTPAAAPTSAPGAAPQIAAPVIPINPLGGSVSAADVNALTKTALQEDARSRIGQQAVVDAIRNRVTNSGQGYQDVLSQPGQFEVRRQTAGPGSPEFEKARSNILASALGLTPDITGGATNFYGPRSQAALGRPPPAWDDGTGQMFGGNKFFARPFAGQPAPTNGPFSPAAMAPQLAAGPPPAQQASAAVPGGAPGQAPAQAVGQQPPAVQAAAGPLQGAGGVPMGPGLQPAERQQIGALQQQYQSTGNPIFLEQAIGIAQDAAKRARTPAPLEPNLYYDAEGNVRSAVRYGHDTGSIPGRDVQTNEATGQRTYTDTGAMLANGMIWQPGQGGQPGRYVMAPGLGAQQVQAPAGSTAPPDTLWFQKPGEAPTPITAAQAGGMGGQERNKLLTDFAKNDQVTHAQTAVSALTGTRRAIADGGLNPATAYGAVENFVRTVTGKAAGLGQVKAFFAQMGMANDLVGQIGSLDSRGRVPANVMRNIDSFMKSYTDAQIAQAQDVEQTYRGADPRINFDLGVPHYYALPGSAEAGIAPMAPEGFPHAVYRNGHFYQPTGNGKGKLIRGIGYD